MRLGGASDHTGVVTSVTVTPAMSAAGSRIGKADGPGCSEGPQDRGPSLWFREPAEARPAPPDSSVVQGTRVKSTPVVSWPVRSGTVLVCVVNPVAVAATVNGETRGSRNIST